MGQTYYDVVIVGGAAVGSAAAYFLASNPDFNGSLLVLEQDPSYQRCATTLSAASIRHQFSTPENIQLSQFGTQFVRQHAEQVGFHEGGYLFLATEAGLPILQDNHRIQRQLGVEVALLSPSELQARFPWLNVSDLSAGSLGLAGEGWLDAYSLLQVLRRQAIAHGAQYRAAKAQAVERRGRQVHAVILENGERIACGTLINAAGAGARALAASAGLALPVEMRKRCVFYFHCATPVAGSPLVIDPSGAYFRPEGQGFIAGIIPPDADPENQDFEVDYSLFEELLWPLLAERVPAFEAIKLGRAWAGHYDVNLLDHNVIVGAHPDLDNLLFANGFSGHGLQQSPGVGRALSELICYGAFRSLDLTRLGWGRVLADEPLLEHNVV